MLSLFVSRNESLCRWHNRLSIDIAENHHHCGRSLAVILRVLRVAGYCSSSVIESAENRHCRGIVLAMVLQALLSFLHYLFFFMIYIIY